MLGQPASWQTVCRPSDFTRLWSSVYAGPIVARVLIHSGLRSIGVSALRTSRRRSLRPSGATLLGGAWVTRVNRTRGAKRRRFRGGAPAGSVLPDVLEPDLGLLGDEPRHHLDALRVVEQHDLHAVLRQPVVPAVEGLCLADDD